MSNYTKSTNFTAKDALSTGDPNKLIKGVDFDTEFDAIATAINSKYDANNVASQAQAEAETLDTVLMTPRKVAYWADANAGVVGDLQAIADPGADRLLGWDESADAATFFDLGTGLSISGTTLQLALGSIDHDSLDNYEADEHVDHSTVSITAGDGLSGGGDITTSRALAVDISGLTTLDIASLAATDSLLVNDGGTMKQMQIQDMGIRVVEETGTQTFALADSNSLQLLTGSTNRTWTIPPNSSVAFPIGATIYVGSRDTATLTLSPDSGVTLTSVNASGNDDQDVSAGGMAAIVKVATDEWMLAGDLA